jgi:hypothetical protein
MEAQYLRTKSQPTQPVTAFFREETPAPLKSREVLK